MRLLVDLGGTNARFARGDGAGGLTAEHRFAVAAFPSFLDALDAYLAASEDAETIRSAGISAAGPVAGGRVQLTNAPWVVEAEAVSRHLGDVPVGLVNDLEAVALSLPHLGDPDLSALRGGVAGPGARLAVNVGTGFGAAVAVPLGAGWTALGGEPGHMRFAPLADEAAALGHIATVEALLSGRGLGNLAEALGSQASDSAAVLAMARSEPAAGEALRLFTQVLGRVAGDLVLATGAWGGLYLTGGVIDAWRGVAEMGPFFAQHDDKGPMAERIAEVPIWHITRKDPAMLGLSLMALG
ncbi:MAG: ROK family protein [Pseudomonadota bacterium]